MARHRPYIIKAAMIAVDQWLYEDKVDAVLMMQVHDELVLEVAEDQVDAVSAKLCQLMESAVELDVPLIVAADVGNNWDEAH